ncbi:MAG TPA: phosphate signaling complex protein PhoU [Armatimonadota bacterium]|jgi:phosphate transport system protein|nr:phosphate signaling complex protein PhoU [Armatimonadota bacterium]HOJ20835.1 phosphate signaling complex protein PhoU [Armatimonadota bacterium]HOM82486.1 phosphate signaling complex protein PhoU [Armatimonadota bacterium]HPO74106.1 phosphate signaling complex protein PhoU [Armatimonadota bacterium]HPT99230.1 phosphate signaling complex protein PhoU [Armatimonadota bacterium]
MQPEVARGVRRTFEDHLSDLLDNVLRMGAAVEEMVARAVEALRHGDVTAGEKLDQFDDVVDEYNLNIENECLQLIALQQPMARDLRTIAATLKIITDIERVGDYAVDVAKTAAKLAERPLFKPLVDIPRMGQLVQEMLRDVLESFVNRDIERIRGVIQVDDAVDALNRQLHDELIGYIEKDPSIAHQAVWLILVARYLERMADHITNIGERVHYMETGELKELHK